MPSSRLKSEETAEIDIGNSNGITITNVSTRSAKFYVDFRGSAAWEPITGETTLAARATWTKTRVELGHDHIRVGARATVDDGADIISVAW